VIDALKVRWVAVAAVAGAVVLVAVAWVGLRVGRGTTPDPSPVALEASPAGDDFDFGPPSESCHVFRGAASEDQAYYPPRHLLVGDVSVLTEDEPLRWRRRSDHRLFELRDGIPVDVGVGPWRQSLLWDDDYWYSEACFAFCERQDSVGIPMSKIRISRRTGAMARLGQGGDPVISATLLHNGFLYWGSSNGCSVGDGLKRVDLATGREQNLGLTMDYFGALRGYPTGILVVAHSTIGWLANGATTIKPVLEIADRNEYLGPAVFDGHAFYVVKRVAAQSGSTIVRVDAATLRVTLVANLSSSVGHLAVHGASLYFSTDQAMSRGNIFVVATKGGDESIAVAEPPSQCSEVTGLWATTAGLVWTRGEDEFSGGAIYAARWSELQSVSRAQGRTK
jgi:hypothetical protein